MKIQQQVRLEPTGEPVPSLGVRVRRKSDGVTLATVTTDADGFALIQGDGHYPPFYLQTTNQVGGPRVWRSDDTLAAGTYSPAEVVYALRAFGDGYIPGFLNNLAPSVASTTVSLATGGALVAGYPVINYTADTFSITRPSSGTRVDRLVARLYGEAHADHGLAEFAILAGTVDAGTPSLTQTTSVYEVSLATVTVPSAGSLTLVDDRTALLASIVSRAAPVTGVARAASVSTSSSGGEALTGLSFNLALTADATYDIEAEIQAQQTVSAAVTPLISAGTYGTGNDNFNFPQQIAVDPSGNLYIADYSNDRLKKHQADGTFTSNLITGLDEVTGVCVDNSGNVYVSYKAGASDYRVRKYNSSGTLQWTGPANAGAFQHLATDNTNVYAANGGLHRVVTCRCSDGVQTTGIGNPGGAGTGDGEFNTPVGVSTDGTYVYVVDYGNSRVQKFTTAGTYVTKWGLSGSGSGQFTQPAGIAYDAGRNLIVVVDGGNNRVQRFTTTGTYVDETGTYGSGSGQFNIPNGVAVDASGNTWVSDRANNRIQKLDWDIAGAVGSGSVAVSIDGNLSAYVGRGATNGAIGNAHTRSVAGPATVTVAAYGKATSDTVVFNGCVLSARAVPRL